jgi:thimet oligopeptidase
MRSVLTSLLLASSTLATTAAAAPLAPRPVDVFVAGILADAPDAATIDRQCDRMIAEATRRQAELEAETGPATIARTLQRFDELGEVLGSIGGESSVYREVMADDARRKAGGACEVRVASAATKISLSRPIYDRLKAIDASKVDAATRLYLKRTLDGYERAGIAFDPKGRAEVQALNDRISQLSTDFETNIANGRKTVSADPAELAGLPADFIAAHKAGSDGKVTISTDYPDLFPVMAYAQSDSLRRRLYEADGTRAYPANDKVLGPLLDTRLELARKLGRKDYATLVLEDKMLDTPAKVEDLLSQMDKAARPASQLDLTKKLAVWQQSHPGANSYDPWSNSFLTNAVQKATYAYDRQEARKFFAYDNVRNGILKLTEDVFGVTIRPWQTTKWDPSVEAYEMLDHGEVIGRFYFDSHPRPGKYNHANMVPLRPGLAGRQIPLGALVMNLPAGGHATGLMEHADVVTFLHEYGHLIHHIFAGKARWAAQSGVATEWDFVEAPSQMLEEWVFDYDTLKTFAVDAQGQPIPRALVDKMNAARYFNLGMGDMRQLALSNVSLRLHQSAPPADLGARTRELDQVYDPLPMPGFIQFQDSFGHLAGYSAIYYTYRWSKVIALDMFTRFRDHGLRDRVTADRYRAMVLAPGGSRPASELVSAFLERPISLTAYKAEVAKDR